MLWPDRELANRFRLSEARFENGYGFLGARFWWCENDVFWSETRVWICRNTAKIPEEGGGGGLDISLGGGVRRGPSYPDPV